MILELRTFYFPSGNILVLCLIKKKEEERKFQILQPRMQRKQILSVTYITEYLKVLKRFKDNGGGGKRRGSQIQEGKAENTFCKHLKRKSSQS